MLLKEVHYYEREVFEAVFRWYKTWEFGSFFARKIWHELLVEKNPLNALRLKNG